MNEQKRVQGQDQATDPYQDVMTAPLAPPETHAIPKHHQ